MNSALRKLIKRSPLNDPQHWDSDMAPPFFDRQSYQQRLDDRVGKNRDGKSIVRLVWGPESIGLFGVPRYWIRRQKDGEGYRYATIKRWYLEKRLEKECYFDSWQRARYAMTEPAETDEKCEECGSLKPPVDIYDVRRCADCGSTQLVRGQAVDRGVPPDDFYVFLWMCAKHEAVDQDAGWPKCCERADRDNHRRCFGEFRNPSNYDLDCVSAGLRRRDNEPWVDPYAPLSASDLALIESASGAQTERLARVIAERQAAILREQRVLSESGGSFYDIGAGQQSRIIIPD